MLSPQSNRYRALFDLSGIWSFCFDPDQHGLAEAWFNGLPDPRPIAVPASWNDQFESGRDYTGIAWYETRLELPEAWSSQPTFVRFNAVNYFTQVWLNGNLLGDHEGGHLPFVFDLSPALRTGSNRLVVRVDGGLAPDRVPPGDVPPDGRDAFNLPYPPGNFDFFPYCGIHRPVVLYTLPPIHIRDLTVRTGLEGSTGIVQVIAQSSGLAEKVRFEVTGHESQVSVFSASDDWEQIRLPNAALWEPGKPHLYELQFELYHNDQVVDAYRLPIGIRSIRVTGDPSWRHINCALAGDNPEQEAGCDAYENLS